MSVALVVGTRPELIKMASVVRACQARGVPVSVIHTGQHYSRELSGVFLEQLGIGAPDLQLGIGSGTHGEQLGRIMEAAEQALVATRPATVLVQGDTNSVLAAAIVANRLGIRVGHVEAGLRSGDRTMPEEINRILVDHLADDLFAPTAVARQNLVAEGVPARRIHVVGNTVVDELQRALRAAPTAETLRSFGLQMGAYLLATVHRQENTDDTRRLAGIAEGLRRAHEVTGLPVVLSLHPRTAARMADARLTLDPSVRVIAPVGYLEFIGLEAGAALILTDSGGLQEEACVLGVPCVTLRDNTERPETIDIGANRLAGADPAAIASAVAGMIGHRGGWPNPFGDGRASARIVEVLVGQRSARPGVPVLWPAGAAGEGVVAGAGVVRPDPLRAVDALEAVRPVVR